MGDPVADGFVTSLNRPGGNLTGVRMRAGEEPTKLLELLHELVPAATVIGMLIYPANLSERDGVAVEAAARTLGLKVALARATTESELTAALASFAQAKANALLINDSRFFDAHTHQLVELATRERWPAVSNNREFALAGGVASYGASIDGAIRQAGVYIGRILKGAQPAGLPVLQPTKFELVINLKAAKALGVEIQPQLLARADEVIE
jgi:putative ABC transport system substrate-binding protein